MKVISQAVRSPLLLYADDSCIFYQHNKVYEIKQQLKDFESICDWLVNNRLSIYFSEDKTKSIIFAGRQRSKNDIRYNHINIKQILQATYPGRMLDKTMPGEPMALKVMKKINGKLKFLYRKKRYLTGVLRNALTCSY